MPRWCCWWWTRYLSRMLCLYKWHRTLSLPACPSPVVVPKGRNERLCRKSPRCCCWLNDHNPISNCPTSATPLTFMPCRPVLSIRCGLLQPPHVMSTHLLFLFYWQRCCYSPLAESLSDEERLANKIQALWMDSIGTSIHEIDNKGYLSPGSCEGWVIIIRQREVNGKEVGNKTMVFGEKR